jgi:hypothetical protein
MTARKRWPNAAEWARLDAIAQAKRIDDLARPLLDGESMTAIEIVQRAGQICRSALAIEKDLQAVGPQEFRE